ncbi:hypothetical protein CEP54_004944 [Fusarium duplospermum]|uniref:Uncharacterized protein n=1 Tax=Fusarium duplospermum TaxID=1325734 RepID=A0A428QF70_9HYPO|nr:hypothetical protein CEP54_004944 [Fusarium duplospermum]
MRLLFSSFALPHYHHYYPHHHHYYFCNHHFTNHHFTITTSITFFTTTLATMESYDQTYGYQTYGRQGYGEPDIEAPEPSPYPDTPEALNPFNIIPQYCPVSPLLPGNGTANLGADHAGHAGHIHFGGQEPYDDQDEDEKFGAEESEEPEMAMLEAPEVSELFGLGRGEATPVDVQRLVELGCPPEHIAEATSTFVDMTNLLFRLNETTWEMAGIDLNNVYDIERRQRAALDYEELGTMLTEKDESDILLLMPGNEEALRVMEEDEGVRNNIHNHHTRMRTILENLVRFMLAIGNRHVLPDLMKGWDFGSRGDALTAYVGIAHGPNGEHYSYVGSATATNPKSGAIGEVPPGPDLPPAVGYHLREYFAGGREPTLPWKVCWKILSAVGMMASEANINAVRQLGTSILQEMGVTYRTQHHDYLLKRCVLWVAIIQQAEEQNLVTGPMDHRYRIQSRALDWGKVSERAEKIAPADLRGKYTAYACRYMYNSSDNQDFNQKVPLRWNWERLAGGLPMTFVQHRPIVYHPEPIQARIKQICKAVLIACLQPHGFLYRRETIARLSASSGSTPTALITHVIDQLRTDVSHCSAVDIQEGAWDDEALKYSIETEFRRIFKDAETNFSWDEIELWKNLPAFETCWEQDDDVQMTGIDSAVEARRHLPEPLPLPHNADGQLKLLLECHVDPEVVKETGTGVPRPGPGPRPKNIREEQPFELRGGDGEPARRSLFFWTSSLPQRRKLHQALREEEARNKGKTDGDALLPVRSVFHGAHSLD